MLLIAPVAVILVAENLGHIKAVGAMTGRDLDPLHRPRLHRRRRGDDGRAAPSGGTGVTTYAENIGVMAATTHLLDRDVRGGRADRAWCWASARSSAR